MGLLRRRSYEKASSIFSNLRNFPPWLLILAAWGVMILPSSLYSYWIYLDIPFVMKRSGFAPLFQLLRPDEFTGRFMPVYYLFYSLLFKIWGFHLQGYFLVQALLILILLVLLYELIKSITHSIGRAVLAILLACTASPVAENVYTICKQEPLALFFMVLWIFLSYRLLATDSFSHSARKWLLSGSIGFVALLAVLTKETMLVIFVFPISGAALAYFFHKRRFLPDNRLYRSFRKMTLLTAASLGTAGILYFALQSANSSRAYVSYPININLISANWHFYWNQQPDVVLIGVGALSLSILLCLQKKSVPLQCILSWSLFLTGTAYFVGQLFWRWPLGYYLLIPSTLWVAVCALSLGSFASFPRFRIIPSAIVVVLVLTRAYSLPYFYYIARAQKTQDALYTAAVEKFLHLARNGERLFLEQWPFYAEPVQQSNTLIRQLLKRPHLKVVGVQDLLQGQTASAEVLRHYRGLPEDVRNRDIREKDFTLVFSGKGQSSLILRGVTPMPNQEKSEYESLGMVMDLRAEKEVKWKYLIARFPIPSLTLQEYVKGFRLYQVKYPLFWEGRWQDRWMGKKAWLSLTLHHPREKLFFQGSVPPFSIPNSLTIRREGRILRKIELKKSEEFSFSLELESFPGNPMAKLELAAEKTFIPKEIGLNRDERKLSIQITAKPQEG